ncbi:ABC transporter ATP-binding protein [Sporolactobacillus sp. Y61]|uniref:ABC transporter ATP-binding protein n=1 Tax=Sporolactobacillus sp. Y61 TaxID=3160863 RepID=A0AAU8IFC9_9BACL
MQIKLEHITADYILGPIHSPKVLNDVSLTLPSGSFTAVVGPTGAGKSSLLKVIDGILMPGSGRVHVGSFTFPGIMTDKH